MLISQYFQKLFRTGDKKKSYLNNLYNLYPLNIVDTTAVIFRDLATLKTPNLH